MRTIRQSLTFSLIFAVASSSAALAQERHVVDPTLVAAVVEQHSATHDADRAAVREALARPEVQAMASRLGLDTERVSASVSTFSAADLERAATAARQVNQALAGGASTVVISTTTIIIILLAVILIVVAVK